MQRNFRPTLRRSSGLYVPVKMSLGPHREPGGGLLGSRKKHIWLFWAPQEPCKHQNGASQPSPTELCLYVIRADSRSGFVESWFLSTALNPKLLMWFWEPWKWSFPLGSGGWVLRDPLLFRDSLNWRGNTPPVSSNPHTEHIARQYRGVPSLGLDLRFLQNKPSPKTSSSLLSSCV